MTESGFLYKDLSSNLDNDTLLDHVHPKDWVNPKPAELYDLVVIGAGPAGLVAARDAAQQKFRVALIERDLIGGDCFNVGCIPSKALIRTARLYADMQNAKDFGGEPPTGVLIDYASIIKRMRHVRARSSVRIAVHRIQQQGIDVFLGTARFSGRNSLTVEGATLNFRKAIIATGSKPRIPDIPGLEEAGYYTNENIFNREVLPSSLAVIGGGPLGCELAQAFCRLGSNVSIIQDDPMFLANIERDGAQILSNAMARDGVGISLNACITKVRVEGNKKFIDLTSDGNKNTIEAEHILVTTGRIPNTEGINLEGADVRYRHRHGININEYLQTSNADIYAVGDVCPDRRFDHVQDVAARAAVSNALHNTRHKLHDLVTPWCIYTTPEVAHVGMHVREARQNGIPVKTYTILMHQVDRAIADGEDEGFVKVHMREGVDEILGATIVARNAGDIINYVSLAMTAKLGLKGLAEASFPYPTQALAIKMAALSSFNSVSHDTLMKPRSLI